MQIPDSQIAVTLYNLRNYCKTESDFAETLDKVCKIGYKAVQVSGVALPADVIRKHLDNAGLYCCATHENIATISGESEPLIERLQTLGCDFTALGSPGPDFNLTSMDDVKRLADIFNKQAEALTKAGIKLGYHNHSSEFTKVKENGKTMLDTFFELTADANVYSELDVHWVTRGGGSPVSWIRKLAGRISVIHFKDFAVVDNTPHFCEIGEGNLDWPEILKACRETGVRWYSIEQDREFLERNIFDSIKISYDNLSSWGVK